MATFQPKTVDVNVFTEGAPAEQQSFEFPLVVIAHNTSNNNIDSFSSLDSLGDAGFAVNSPAYNIANGCFAGGIAAPSLVKIARAIPASLTLTVSTLVPEDGIISVNASVNGANSVVTYTVQSGDSDTDAIATGLAASLTTAFPTTDSANPVFSVSGSVITATIASDTHASSFGWASLTGTLPHVRISSVTASSLPSIVDTALSQDDDVSFLMSEYHDSTNVAALAAHAETLTVQYFTTSNEAGIKDGSNTSNLALTLGALGYRNTNLDFFEQADFRFPEAARVGNIAGLNPYQLYSNQAYRLRGVPTDALTEQEFITLASRNVGFQRKERGAFKYQIGRSMSGIHADTVTFILWSEYTVQGALDNLLTRQANLGRAVPYSDAGATMMEQVVINDYIAIGVRGGRILTGTTQAEDGRIISLEPLVNFGARADQSNADIQNRIWRDGNVEVVMGFGVDAIKLNLYILTNRTPAA